MRVDLSLAHDPLLVSPKSFAKNPPCSVAKVDQVSIARVASSMCNAPRSHMSGFSLIR